MNPAIAFLQKHSKPIIIFIFVVAIAIFCLIWTINSLKNSSLLIQVTPTSATVNIDGAEYSNGLYKLYPQQSAQVTISQDGFETKSFTINLDSGRLAQINTYLTNTTTGLEYYLTNQDDYNLLTQISDQNVQNFVSEVNNLSNIQDILPIERIIEPPANNSGTTPSPYKIIIQKGELSDGCSKITCLIIQDNLSDNHSTALNLIREKGFNPTNYEIIYRSLTQ